MPTMTTLSSTIDSNSVLTPSAIMKNTDSFAPVTPNASLLIAWQLRDRRVLLVGGGSVASGRLNHILEADAYVTVVCPRDGMHPMVYYRIFEDETTRDRITYFDRNFGGPEDLEGVDMVLTAIDDPEASRAICHMARARKIPVNVADDPPDCDFYFGPLIRRGPLQIMLSSNGKAPKLASMIAHKIEHVLPQSVGDAMERVGELRIQLRRRAPGVGGPTGQRRMQWMIHVCEKWTLDELAMLDQDMVTYLLDEGWAKGDRVPSFVETQRALGRELPVTHKTFKPSQDLLIGAGTGVLFSFAALIAWGMYH